MSASELFYSLRPGVLIIFFILLLVLLLEAGYRLGRRRRSLHGEAKSMIEGIQTEIAAVLGLLLGFSFAMSVARFEARRQLVVDESNAIGTAYLRTQLLPEPQRASSADLLRQYLDLRLESTQSNVSATSLRMIEARTARLQEALWAQAMTLADGNPKVTLNLFIQALNDVFDIRSTRNRTLQEHVPSGVILLLLAASALTVGIKGYQGGLAGTRASQASLALCLLIGLVTFAIFDLDRPRQGLIRVSQQSMEDLKISMAAPPYRIQP